MWNCRKFVVWKENLPEGDFSLLFSFSPLMGRFSFLLQALLATREGAGLKKREERRIISTNGFEINPDCRKGVNERTKERSSLPPEWIILIFPLLMNYSPSFYSLFQFHWWKKNTLYKMVKRYHWYHISSFQLHLHKTYFLLPSEMCLQFNVWRKAHNFF